MSNPAHTPGFNCRISIFFQNDRKGRRVAYRWSRAAMRAIRMSLADAELFIAQGQADQIPGHPLKG